MRPLVNGTLKGIHAGPDVLVPSLPAPASPGPEVALDGTVERITFYNPTNGFSVVRLRVRGRREPIAVVGTLPAAQPGELLALVGRWQIDPRHGAQFRPSSAEVRRPSDVEGIVRYLGSGLVRQIGPVLAKRIVGVFGTQTLEILDASAERVREVPGIGPQRARAIAAAWAEHRALRDVMAFLAEHGLDTRYAPRLLSAYGTDALRILNANPYRLVADVPGLGFPSADRIGQDRGIRHTAPARIQAAVQAALLTASQNGHTRQLRPVLVAATATVAEVTDDLAESAVTQLLAGGAIAVRQMTASRSDGANLTPQPHGENLTPQPPLRRGEGEQDAPRLPLSAPVGVELAPPVGDEVPRGRVRIYSPADLPASAVPPAPPEDDGLGIGLSGFVRAEEDLARRLLGLARRGGLPARHVARWLAADAESKGLSDEQRAAVATAATSGCFILTGGPGVGKTTTTRALVRCLQALGRSVALGAPTGKAARRLGEVVGIEARTLHRLLGAGPSGFRHNTDDPLPYDVTIVDESSMLDTQLARAVVRAIGPGSQLILVGDADQLPSVGAGQVLRDVLESGRVPSARLETVFRQAALSQIVTNAHRIRQGLLPELAPTSKLLQKVGGSDCVFVSVPAAQVATVAAEWASTRLPRLLGVPAGEVQAIAPLVRVCQTLNAQLQERLNPARGQGERPHGALPLRVGDRVIQTHNNYLLGVFNGDTGTIVEMDNAGGVTVDFGDGRVVQYGAGDLLDLDHAYGLTVHRAQGSEWPGVVVLASSSFGPILSRNLLYTALTRARRAVVVVGDEAAIAAAVARTRDQERVTGLPVLLQTGAERPGAMASAAEVPIERSGVTGAAVIPDLPVSERPVSTRAHRTLPASRRPIPARPDDNTPAHILSSARPATPRGARPTRTRPEVPASDARARRSRGYADLFPEDEPPDAPLTQVVDDGAVVVYDPMPDDWPD